MTGDSGEGGLSNLDHSLFSCLEGVGGGFLYFGFWGLDFVLFSSEALSVVF